MISYKEYVKWWKDNKSCSLKDVPNFIREFNKAKRAVVDTHQWEYIEHRYVSKYSQWNHHKFKCKVCNSIGSSRENPNKPDICKTALTCEEAQIKDIIE